MSPGPAQEGRLVRHASAVAIGNFGVLIEGPSGSGKSSLALQLMALGAELIADDRTRITDQPGHPWLRPPERLAGVIEARGFGLLQVPARAGAPLRLIVDMAAPEPERLPERREEVIFGVPIRRIRRVDAAHFPGAIVALAKGGWWQDV